MQLIVSLLAHIYFSYILQRAEDAYFSGKIYTPRNFKNNFAVKN